MGKQEHEDSVLKGSSSFSYDMHVVFVIEVRGGFELTKQEGLWGTWKASHVVSLSQKSETCVLNTAHG